MAEIVSLLVDAEYQIDQNKRSMDLLLRDRRSSLPHSLDMSEELRPILTETSYFRSHGKLEDYNSSENKFLFWTRRAQFVVQKEID